MTYYASQERVEPGSVIAVYDLGGGTFDAAVVRKTADGVELLGTPEGIERLGGVDFDEAVFAHVAAALGGALGELDPDDPAAMAAVLRLRAECVEAKEALSADTEVSIPVLLPNVSTEVRLTRAELEAMIRPPLADSLTAMRRALRSAGVEAAGLTAVLLAGGSSRIPLVAQLVSAELGRPVAVDAHPKHGVALGAAQAAAAAAGHVAVATARPPAPRPRGAADRARCRCCSAAAAAAVPLMPPPVVAAPPTGRRRPRSPRPPPRPPAPTTTDVAGRPMRSGADSAALARLGAWTRRHATGRVTAAGATDDVPSGQRRRSAPLTGRSDPRRGARRGGDRRLAVVFSRVAATTTATRRAPAAPRRPSPARPRRPRPPRRRWSATTVTDRQRRRPRATTATRRHDHDRAGGRPGLPRRTIRACCIEMTGIEIVGDSIVVDWTPFNFEPAVDDLHAHFFWNTTRPEEAGTNAADFGATPGPVGADRRSGRSSART